MKKTGRPLLMVILLFITCSTAFAQSETGWKLFGQYNGTDVRLIWSRSEWPADVQGIVVKKKVNGAAWKVLSSTPIYPMMSMNKKINNITNDPQHIAALEKKRMDKPTNYSIDTNKFVGMITKKNGLMMTMFGISQDYDNVLLAGLGYEDKGITGSKNTKIEYGIFIQVNNKFSDNAAAVWTCQVKVPTTVDLSAVSNVKASKINKEIEARWTMPEGKIAAAGIVTTFNVYRTLNSKRELVSSKQTPSIDNGNSSVIRYWDRGADMNVKISYEMVPLSILGWELPSQSAIYDPTKFPDVFKPELVSTYKEGDKNFTFSVNIPEKSIQFIDSIQFKEGQGYSANRIAKYSGNVKSIVLPADSNRTAYSTYTFRIDVYVKDEQFPVRSNEVNVYYLP